MPAASPEQVAAIAAGLECFRRATTAPAGPPAERVDLWRRTAILEGVTSEPNVDAEDAWPNT